MTESPKADRYDQFVALFARHERAVRGVIRSLLPTSQDADEVMQEVGLTCWHKFSDFQADNSQDAFFRWACVVARFEILKYRRKCARDRLVLSDETIQLLSVEAEDRSVFAESERRALEDCLNELPPADQRLLLSVHTRGDSVAEIARQLGHNVRRLYGRVNALRDLLGECVRRKLAEGGN
jgi:RNA polymerase sigma-70 factor (ECF subfamily)